MSTMKLRVRDLRVGDHVSMVATGIEMAVMKIEENVPGIGVDRFGKPTTGPKTKLYYTNRATKLVGHVALDADVMVIFDEWPYGPRTHHQECCKLFSGALECDCAASDESDTEWGASHAGTGRREL